MGRKLSTDIGWSIHNLFHWNDGRDSSVIGVATFFLKPVVVKRVNSKQVRSNIIHPKIYRYIIPVSHK